jgi:RNA recognition motif-containing protein
VSTTLHVSNLPLSATEDMLAGKFGQFGVVVSIRINRHPDTGLSQRSVFVEMQNADGAQKAINGLNFADYDGRLISVYRSVGRTPVSN